MNTSMKAVSDEYGLLNFCLKRTGCIKKQIICSAECHVVIIITNADENVSTYVQREGSLYIHMY